MPSHSARQALFMKIAAHDKDFAKKHGIAQDVAEEFVEADKKKEKKEDKDKKAKKK